MMSTKPNRASVAPPALAREEYDFSSVPKHELKDCLHYEYMRESEAIIREVNKVKRQLSKEARRQGRSFPDVVGMQFKFTKVMKHPGAIIEGAIFLLLAFCEKFPESPWQKLSDPDKKWVRDLQGKAIRSHNKWVLTEAPLLVMDTFLKDPTLGKSTLNDFKTKRTPPTYRKLPASDLEKILVSGFFQINMEYEQGRLVRAFRDWLKANHPVPTEKKKERRGRNAQRDPLNALGALRLRHFCRTLNEAQKLIAPLASNLSGMHYSDRTGWNRACGAAVRHFRNLLKLSDVHLPIHYTKGWQK